MTFRDYIKTEIPRLCGAEYPDSVGKVAELVFDAEMQGEDLFKQNQFLTVRDRAKLLICFIPSDFEAYERCLIVLALTMINHYEAEHKEFDTFKVEKELLQDNIELSVEESQMVAADWWMT